jgi:hypothetical protein
VRVGIKAPRSVQVHREEVYQELQKANVDAASPSEHAVEVLSEMLRSGRTAGPVTLSADLGRLLTAPAVANAQDRERFGATISR